MSLPSVIHPKTSENAADISDQVTSVLAQAGRRLKLRQRLRKASKLSLALRRAFLRVLPGEVFLSIARFYSFEGRTIVKVRPERKIRIRRVIRTARSKNQAGTLSKRSWRNPGASVLTA